ncbi:methyltransferase domain-containing protein [Micromonospora sp. NPDC005173]|uniref:methyltransferase domain-containing protein n=1 Tax=Micromonospora sp. NPDC005173 TaxID=3157165 RepID=UPI0033B710CD
MIGRTATVARERWPAGEFHVGDAYELPLETGSVTYYRADKVLHMLDDPARAVAEARRVLAPGGRAVLLGQDWDTIAIDSDEPETTRRLVHAKADSLPSPRVARRYRNLLLDAGFTDPVAEVHTAVFTDYTAYALLQRITDEESWLAEQAERARANRIFVVVPMFLVAAQGWRPTWIEARRGGARVGRPPPTSPAPGRPALPGERTAPPRISRWPVIL